MIDALRENKTVPTATSRCTVMVPMDNVDSWGVIVVQVPAWALLQPAAIHSRNIIVIKRILKNPKDN
ncbi:hypothetical protein AC520_0192 [Enterobacter sp. OLF]|nr:hypothetical protein AC520_0192 [Enterobacter sp. OLF]